MTTPSEPTQTPAPQLLDDETAARVLQEYIGLSDVEENEINHILAPGARLSYRDGAIALRMSTVLEIPAPFELPPLYALAREMIDRGADDDSDDETNVVMHLLAEALCVGAGLLAVERESLLMSVLAAILPAGHMVDGYLAAIDQRVLGGKARAA